MNADLSKPEGEKRHDAGKPRGLEGQWSEPLPAVIPAPTYWPMVLAFGTTLMGLNLVTSPFFFYVGLPVVVLALYHWIRELRS